MDHAVAEALAHYLQQGRTALLRALAGLDDYDARRPLTRTGTNILGLVKHLVGVERGYLGECVGRPPDFTLPWEEDGSIWAGADMWVRADEPRHYIIDLYHQVWRNSDASIRSVPLDAEAEVSWWPEGERYPSFGSLIARVVAETAQHAGHAEILREGLDGQAGADADSFGDGASWAAYVADIQRAAEPFRPGPRRAPPGNPGVPTIVAGARGKEEL